MTDELKPVNCGCGGEAQTENYDANCGLGKPRYVYDVYCEKCMMSTAPYDTEAEAITAWNTAMGGLLPEGDPQKNIEVEFTNSTERKAKVEGNRCTACDNHIRPCMKYCDYCGARLEWE